MMALFSRNPPVRDLTPEDVARGLAEDRMILVDVREPNETAVERYPGALIVPLSTFDPAAIPDPQGREVVFACRSGRRSVPTSQAARSACLPYDAHLAGGMLAWKAAGLPTESYILLGRDRCGLRRWLDVAGALALDEGDEISGAFDHHAALPVDGD